MKKLILISCILFGFIFRNEAQLIWDSSFGGTKKTGKEEFSLNISHINSGSIKVENITFPVSTDRIILNFKKIDEQNFQVSTGSTPQNLPVPLNQISISCNGNTLVLKVNALEEPESPNPTATVRLISTNLYQDALNLSKNVNVTEIQSKYNWDGTNPYLKSIQIPSGDLHAGGNTAINRAVDYLGGLDVTKYADGLAKFIVGRVKEELAISFFNKLTAKFEEPEIRDTKILFKNTHNELSLISDKIYNFNAYMPVLKQGFRNDLKNIPVSLKTLVDDSNSQIGGFLENHPNEHLLTNIGFQFYEQINDKVFVGKIVNDLNLGNVSNVDSDLFATFQTIKLLSFALTNDKASTTQFWISGKNFREMVNEKTNPNHLKYFIGLLAEVAKNEGIKFGDKTFYQILINQSDKIDKIKAALESYHSIITTIQTAQQNFAAANSETEKQEKIVQYLEAASALLQNVGPICNLIQSPEFCTKVNFYSNISYQLSQIIINHQQKKYANSLINLAGFVNILSNSDLLLSKLTDFISTQGQFIAQIAEAENSDEVNKIIENFAAPIGSWRDKRIAKFNIAVDSYLGPTQYLNGRFGISTPVGLSFSFSDGKGLGVTIMPSIFDIGPITAARFTNSSDVAKIYLKEIISPGIFASIGFGKNMPVNLNFGYQQMPLLTKVDATNTVSLKKENAASISLTVNVPLTTLLNNK